MPQRMETLTLPPEPQSAGQARTFVRQICDEANVDADVCFQAILLTSETVTNAITHGRSEVRLAVMIDGPRIRVEVGDDNSRLPIPQTEDPDALDGRGLAMVEAITSAWGVELAPYGKVVWFELYADLTSS